MTRRSQTMVRPCVGGEGLAKEAEGRVVGVRGAVDDGDVQALVVELDGCVFEGFAGARIADDDVEAALVVVSGEYGLAFSSPTACRRPVNPVQKRGHAMSSLSGSRPHTLLLVVPTPERG